MNTLARLVCLLAIAAGATASQVAAAAGDPANGGMLYSANCAKCHALPPIRQVLRAADPVVLQDAIASVPEMSVQPNLLALTFGQITDIAAYIATFVTAAPANYQGLWWNAPANSESGWGINFAHQGDTIFASWFTYDTTGRGWWVVMTAQKTGTNTYSGKLYTTRGPAFSAVPFDPSMVVATEAGTGTLTFTDANNGTFNYVIGATNQTKTITREAFGPLPICQFGTVADVTTATNYQDLWWKMPATSESGWGINLNHEGDTIFATWFTYDLDGSPLWLVVSAVKTAPGVYTGDLYRTTGPAFNAVPFDATKVVATKVGTATFTFANGNNANFAYTVQLAGMASPVTQAKAIIREIFTAPGTTCQ
jgi:hypothetical protein